MSIRVFIMIDYSFAAIDMDVALKKNWKCWFSSIVEEYFLKTSQFNLRSHVK